MSSFIMHIFLSSLIFGLGFLTKVLIDGFGELDLQIDRLLGRVPLIQSTQAETEPLNTAVSVPAAMSHVKLTADPDKLAQLKTAMKGSKDA